MAGIQGLLESLTGIPSQREVTRAQPAAYDPLAHQRQQQTQMMLRQQLGQSRGPFSTIGGALGLALSSGKGRRHEQARQRAEREKSERTNQALMGYFGGDPGQAVGSGPPSARAMGVDATSPGTAGFQGRGPEALIAALTAPGTDQKNLTAQIMAMESLFPKQGPAAEQERFETVNDPLGRGGVGQRSTTSGKLVNYQGAQASKGDAEYDNWFHPESGEAATARKGSKEAQRLSKGGYIKGTHKQREGGVPLTEALSFSKEFTKESSEFKKTQDAFRRVASSADRKTPGGDLSLVFNFMKTLDPGSVVRESEYATAENARAVPDTVRNIYNRVVDGLRLTDGQRTDFVTTAATMYMGQAEQQTRRRGEFQNLADQYKVPEVRAAWAHRRRAHGEVGAARVGQSGDWRNAGPDAAGRISGLPAAGRPRD